MSPIFNDPGWISLMETKYGLKHIRLIAGEEQGDAAFASISVFVNAKGKLRTPRLMPYMPVDFRPTQTTSQTKLQRQWLTLGEELATQMNHLGYGGAVSLDPEVTDARPWQWQHLTAQVRYTFRFNLPKDLSTSSSAVRKNIKKAQNSGYSVEETSDSRMVIDCLNASEDRQAFGYGLLADDLDYLRQNMEPGTFRMYLAKDGNGEPASGRVILAPKGGTAIDLVAGTFASHLKSGVTQLIIAHALEDLANTGVSAFDYGGANIQSVASSKMEWGCDLVPFYTLDAIGPRSIAIQGKRWLYETLQGIRK